MQFSTRRHPPNALKLLTNKRFLKCPRLYFNYSKLIYQVDLELEKRSATFLSNNHKLSLQPIILQLMSNL